MRLAPFIIFYLILLLILENYISIIYIFKVFIGDWGLGIGDWGLGPIPNPQSPIPNPQSPIFLKYYLVLNIKQ